MTLDYVKDLNILSCLLEQCIKKCVHGPGGPTIRPLHIFRFIIMTLPGVNGCFVAKLFCDFSPSKKFKTFLYSKLLSNCATDLKTISIFTRFALEVRKKIEAVSPE